MLLENFVKKITGFKLVLQGSPFVRGAIFFLVLMLLGGCAIPRKNSQVPQEDANQTKKLRQVPAKELLTSMGDSRLSSNLYQPLISGPLTLSSALALAEKLNPLLKAKRKELGIAEGELEQASLLFQNNPELSIGLARRHTLSPEDPGNFTDSGIELSQEFEVWGQPKARRQAAKAAFDVVLAEIGIVKWDVLGQVRKEFMNLLFAAKRRSLLEKQGNFIETILQLSERQLKAGEISKMEHRQMKILIAALQKKVEEARVNEETAASMLRFSLGISPNNKLQVTSEVTSLQWEPSRADQILTEILENHPGLRHQRLLIEKLRKELILVQKEARFNITGSLFFDNEPRDNRTYGIGISMPIQVFNGRKGTITASRKAVEAAMADMKAVEQNLITEVKMAISRLNSAYKTASLYDREILSAIQENQKLLEKSFRLGEIGLVDLRVSQRELLDAEREALDAAEEFYIRLAAVEGFVGHEIKFPSNP